MTITAFYRLAVWMPLVLPAVVWLSVSAFGWPAWGPLEDLTSGLLYTLVYGGIPYGVLAIWATWWIDERPEGEIRRLALRAPLLTIAAWAVLVTYVGIRARSVDMAAGLFGLGALAVLVTGYAYVAVVFGIRALIRRMQRRNVRDCFAAPPGPG